MTITFLQALIGRVQEWNRRRATVRTLRALPDWQLRDIGLTRDQIATAVDAALGVSPLPRAGKRLTANQLRIGPDALGASGSGGKAVTT